MHLKGGVSVPDESITSGEGCFTRADGFYPDALDCSGYYRCTGGSPLHLVCPAGSTFHPKQKTCTFTKHELCPGVGRQAEMVKPTKSDEDTAREEFMNLFGPESPEDYDDYN